jgi:hypothetical protein
VKVTWMCTVLGCAALQCPVRQTALVDPTTLALSSLCRVTGTDKRLVIVAGRLLTALTLCA